jgi:hypothetical protein
LIFSLLNLRKKTAAGVAGISIGVACLWGLSIWQNISREEMLDIMLAVLVMLSAIIGGALLIVVVFKTLMKLLGKLVNKPDGEDV